MRHAETKRAEKLLSLRKRSFSSSIRKYVYVNKRLLNGTGNCSVMWNGFKNRTGQRILTSILEALLNKRRKSAKQRKPQINIIFINKSFAKFCATFSIYEVLFIRAEVIRYVSVRLCYYGPQIFIIDCLNAFRTARETMGRPRRRRAGKKSAELIGFEATIATRHFLQQVIDYQKRNYNKRLRRPSSTVTTIINK